MSRNDAEDFAQRLYARVPGQYRAADQEQGLPLLALFRVIGEQVANVRHDLDALWENFFIETCADWAVPYLGALVGANLLAHPVGHSNRQDVRNTIIWRRSKGTPEMLRALAGSISGWPVDLEECFQTLGWSQNMNHTRMTHPLTPDLRQPAVLALLGRAGDPLAHAADFKPARPLDQSRADRAFPVAAQAAWGTPGRHQIRNLAFFARRLSVFPVTGATPASVAPGLPPPAQPACFTFDPLFREIPLYVSATGKALTRAAFDNAPWDYSPDVSVRMFGIPLTAETQPEPAFSASGAPFDFGGRAAGLALHATAGLRLMNVRDFTPGGAHFTIAAQWQGAAVLTELGRLSTLEASSGAASYHAGAAAPGSGRLRIEVRAGFAGMPPVQSARFPGSVVAVRAVPSGPPRRSDTLYVYLPAGLVTQSQPLVFHISSDGASYSSPALTTAALARSSEGEVYPPRVLSSSRIPASSFASLSRGSGGMRIADPSRFGGLGVLIRADVCTGDFQPLGAIATIAQSGASPSGIPVPNPWPALTYAPSTDALTDNLPSASVLKLLSIHLTPLSGDFLPAAELIVANRRGESLLIYLPEVIGVPAVGIGLFVASDGSTYFAPASQVDRLRAVNAQSLAGLPLARPSAGQVLPVPGTLPILQRRPVGMNLCRCERSAFLKPGEFGIDPELGRFAFVPNDPAIGTGNLSVNYGEAFGDRIGALVFDRQLDRQPVATRFVSQSGDAPLPGPVHATIASAIAAAANGDVIEVLDSRTYASAAPVDLAVAAVRNLTLRAGTGQRPCLTFYSAAGAPLSASLRVTAPMDSLNLNGILISGGPIRIESAARQVHFTAVTLDPRVSPSDTLIATDTNRASQAEYLFCRSITGGLKLDVGVSRVTLADSIVDNAGGIAIAGVRPENPPAGTVQLERVTILGRISCEVLDASESILDDVVTVEDRQAGCIRFSRYETGSILPRRFQCIPDEEQARACRTARCLVPLFASRAWGNPAYLMLAAGGPAELLTASEEAAEPGAFAGRLNAVRLENLFTKLREFMPAGLLAVVIGET